MSKDFDSFYNVDPIEFCRGTIKWIEESIAKNTQDIKGWQIKIDQAQQNTEARLRHIEKLKKDLELLEKAYNGR